MPADPDIGISIDSAEWLARLPQAEQLVAGAVAAALAAAGAGDAELGVSLADDAAVRRLNRLYRGQDKPTNVLSFPGAPAGPPGAPRALGDIVLARETVVREAESQGKPLADHVAHLAVHGTLHLLGYDHETEDQAAAMERLEARVLAGLGIADPYSDGPAEEE